MKKDLPIKRLLFFILTTFFAFQVHAFELSTATKTEQLYYHRAFEVALWAMPATDSFATRAAVIRDLKGKANDIAINTKPMNSDIHLVALQSQTPYLQGAIDLNNGPVVVVIPKATKSSHLYGAISSAWQRPLEDIDVGLDGWDKGKGAKYLIVPPNYKKELPSGYKIMRSSTYLQNFLIRSISTDGWQAAVEYGYKMQIYPLSQAAKPAKTRFLDMSKTVYKAAPAFDADYFQLVNMVIQEEPINDYDKNMLGMANYIGLEKGKAFKPSKRQSAILAQVAKDVQNYLIKVSNGISWVPAEGQPGWTRFNLFPEDIKQGKRYIYEDANGAIDYQRRAAIDYWAYCMPAVLGSGTMYNVAMVDADDQPIDSAKNYKINMAADFPARNFWSVFAYDSHTRTFINNGTKGRHLSSNDKLVKNKDGSIDIYIGPKEPKGLVSNWIETIPGSEIFIGIRTYGPKESVLKGDYKMPRFTEIK
ncbi:MAG: DUF1254 domain-containing protein [Oleispira sp.]|nr:DUF1254 domain-containing protein [Oleispira sp.]MBL4880015.1 DUF1254 domain-containing protein [Oleispira sp.]